MTIFKLNLPVSSMMKTLSLNKARHILQSVYQWYLKHGDDGDQKILEEKMLQLEKSILSKDRLAASEQAQNLETFSKEHCKKGVLTQTLEVLGAIAIALVLAIIVRQMWFELYEIPTGSMRPTYREQDRLAVSKTPFGINIPLTTGHWLFDPQSLKRGEVVTFTTEGIADLDEDTAFLGFIPYKKRLIKRLIGKPGDSLYFYGGKIYGVDEHGNPLTELLTASWGEKLEHIPFLTFEGRVARKGRDQFFSQMNQQIGKLSLLPFKQLQGTVYNGHEWVKDDPAAQNEPHNTIKAYSDVFGIKNYAMARLLTKKQLSQLQDVDLKEIPEGVLYLELRHNPSLTFPKPILLTEVPFQAMLTTFRSIIPLQAEHLARLMENLYTARFIVKGGQAIRYSVEGDIVPGRSIPFKGVPDGKYEFYYGKLMQVGWGGKTSPIDRDNLLLSHDPSNVQKLFNFGVDFNNVFSPQGTYQYHYPPRYAYFRDGALYVMGAEFLKRDDPTLIAFADREIKRQSSSAQLYVPFKDSGQPVKDGQFDVDFIRTFGFKVPKGSYFVLGDNHAMSGDSRIFGVIPEENLQGTPSFLMWPAGDRWGVPPRVFNGWTASSIVVWLLASLAAGGWYLYHWRYLHRPIILKQAKRIS